MSGDGPRMQHPLGISDRVETVSRMNGNYKCTCMLKKYVIIGSKWHMLCGKTKYFHNAQFNSCIVQPIDNSRA